MTAAPRMLVTGSLHPWWELSEGKGAVTVPQLSPILTLHGEVFADLGFVSLVTHNPLMCIVFPVTFSTAIVKNRCLVFLFVYLFLRCKDFKRAYRKKLSHLLSLTPSPASPVIKTSVYLQRYPIHRQSLMYLKIPFHTISSTRNVIKWKYK